MFARSGHGAGLSSSLGVECGMYECTERRALVKVLLSGVSGKKVVSASFERQTVSAQHTDSEDGIYKEGSSEICFDHEKSSASLPPSCSQE